MRQLTLSAIALALSALAASSHAHIGYNNRNFGNIVNGSSVTIQNQAVPSNYGWIDAADTALAFDANLATVRSLGLAAGADIDEIPVGLGVDNLYLGDSHKGRAFRLHLDSTLTVSFSAMAKANATASSIGGLLPGFSVYKGLAAVSPFTPPQTSADYDFSAISQAWRTGWAQANVGPTFDLGATQGNWNALGDWKTGGDNDNALSEFQFVGYGMDSDRDGDASLSLLLGPGDYTVYVGGIDIANKGTPEALKGYGLSLTVSAVPEPHAALLMLLGLPLLALRRLAARD
jgi:hypothetical protein